MTAMAMTACTGQKVETHDRASLQDDFNYVVDQFADLQILRYQVPGIRIPFFEAETIIISFVGSRPDGPGYPVRPELSL